MMVIFFAFNSTLVFSQNYIQVGEREVQGNIYHTGGNIGIGTTQPNAMLDINSSIGNGILLKSGYSGAHSALLKFQTADNLVPFFVQSNIKVGIGTDIPTATLHISDQNPEIKLDISNQGGKGQIKFAYNNQVKSKIYYDSQTGFFSIKHNNTNAISINHNGNVLMPNNVNIGGQVNASEYYLNGEPFVGSLWYKTTENNNLYYYDGNVGIGTNNPVEKFQIGNLWTFHNGGTKIIGYNFNYHSSKGTSRIADGFVSELRFSENGNIEFRFAPEGEAGSSFSDITGMKLHNNGNVTMPNKVGIGTSEPQASLQISSTDHKGIILERLDGINDNTKARIGITNTNENVGLKFLLANDGENYQNTLFLRNDGNVGIGTSAPEARLELNNGALMISGSQSLNQGVRFQINTEGSYAHQFVEFKNVNGIQFEVMGDGTVNAKKLRLETEIWKDEVFYPEYELITIDSLETFVNENNHLPDIPSETEVIEEGLDVGEMQTLQMQKIEELTLYIIELNKRIEALEKENEKLKENK